MARGLNFQPAEGKTLTLFFYSPILRKLGAGRIEVAGVEVSKIEKDFKTPFERILDPGHSDADAAGCASGLVAR